MNFMRHSPVRVPEPLHGAPRTAPERRIAAARSHAAGLVAALAERFPVVQRLVGDDFFRTMARAYVTQEPPRAPVLRQLGATFPAFIDGFAPAAAIGYLGDVARLELARSRAGHAADAAPASAGELAALVPAELVDMCVTLHPSVSVVASRHPIVSLWEAHRDPDAIVPVQSWAGETALVARPFYAVDTWRLPPGGGAFLTALARGLTIAKAAQAGYAAADRFDTASNLDIVFGARIVTQIASELAPMPR